MFSCFSEAECKNANDREEPHAFQAQPRAAIPGNGAGLHDLTASWPCHQPRRRAELPAREGHVKRGLRPPGSLLQVRRPSFVSLCGTATSVSSKRRAEASSPRSADLTQSPFSFTRSRAEDGLSKPSAEVRCPHAAVPRARWGGGAAALRRAADAAPQLSGSAPSAGLSSARRPAGWSHEDFSRRHKRGTQSARCQQSGVPADSPPSARLYKDLASALMFWYPA